MADRTSLDGILRAMVLDRKRHEMRAFGNVYCEYVEAGRRCQPSLWKDKQVVPERLPNVPLQGLSLVRNDAVGGVNAGGIDRYQFAAALFAHVENAQDRNKLVSGFLQHLQHIDKELHLHSAVNLTDEQCASMQCVYDNYQKELERRQADELERSLSALMESGPQICELAKQSESDDHLTDTDGESDEEAVVEFVRKIVPIDILSSEQIPIDIVTFLDPIDIVTFPDFPPGTAVLPEAEDVYDDTYQSDEEESKSESIVLVHANAAATPAARPYKKRNAYELKARPSVSECGPPSVDVPFESRILGAGNTVGANSPSTHPDADFTLLPPRMYVDQVRMAPYAGIYTEKVPTNIITPVKLARLAMLISQPLLLSNSQVDELVLWLVQNQHHSIRLFVASPDAVMFIRAHPDYFAVSKVFIMPKNEKLSTTERALLLRMRVEALYLAWVVLGCLPNNLWDAVLLMYEGTRAYYGAQQEIYAGMGIDIKKIGYSARIQGEGFMDNVRSAFKSAQEYLQEAYTTYVTPTLEKLVANLTREKIDAAGQMLRDGFTRLGEYGSKVYDNVSDYAGRAYDQLSVYGKQAATKVREYAQKVSDKVRSLSAEDFAAKLTQTREWLKERASAVAQYVRENPTFQKVLASMRQFVEEAKQHGVTVYEYMKTKAPEVQEYFANKMTELDELMRESGVKIKNWIKTKVPAEAEALVEKKFDQEQDKQEERIAQEPNFSLEMDPTDDREIRNFQRNMAEQRRQNALRHEEQERERLAQVESPPSVAEQIREEQAEEVLDALNEPVQSTVPPRPMMPPSPVQVTRTRVPIATPSSFTRAFIEPQPERPAPPAVKEVPSMVRETPSDWIDRMQTTQYTEPLPFASNPTHWNPDTAEMDKDRIISDLQSNMAGMEYWLAQVPNTEYYNPALVSSSIAQIERFFWESPERERERHTYDNNTYRVLASFPETPSDRIARNTLIKNIVHDISMILREAVYGDSSSSIDDVTHKDDTISDAINYLLANGMITQRRVDDVYALVRLMNKKDLARNALTGPYDQRIAGGVPVVTNRNAVNLYHLHSANEPLSAEQQKSRIAHSLHELLGDPHNQLQRSIMFERTQITLHDIESAHLLQHGRQVLLACVALKEQGRSSALNAFKIMAFDLVSDGKSRSYDRTERMRQTGNFLSWLHSLGVLLDWAHSIEDPNSVHVQSMTHLGSAEALRTWDTIVVPAFAEISRDYQAHFHSKHDPISLGDLNRAFTKVLQTKSDPRIDALYLRKLLDMLDTTDGGLSKFGARQLHVDLLHHRIRHYRDNVQIGKDMRASADAYATVHAVGRMKHTSRWLWLEIEKYGLNNAKLQNATLAQLRNDGRYAHLLTLLNVNDWVNSMHFQIDFAMGLNDHHTQNPHMYFRKNAIKLDGSPDLDSIKYDNWDPAVVLAAKQVPYADKKPTVIMDANDAQHPTMTQAMLVAKHVDECASYEDVLRGFDACSIGRLV